MAELPEDINLRAHRLRELRAAQEAAHTAAEAERRKRAMEIQAEQAGEARAVASHAVEVKDLCDRFYRWAVRNNVERTHSGYWRLKGWRLASHVSFGEWAASYGLTRTVEYHKHLWITT